MVGPIRFAGLASGMDTDQIVRDLMKAHRIPLDKLKQQQQQQIWQRETYRELNTLFATFNDKTVFNLRLQGTFLQKKVTSENQTNLAVRNVGTSSLESYRVEVKSDLATPPSSASVKFTLASKITNSKEPFGEINFSDDPDGEQYLPEGELLSFNLTGNNGTQQISIGSHDSIDSVVAKINAYASKTGVRASYASDGSLTFMSTVPGAESKIQITDLDITSANILGISEGTIEGIKNEDGEFTGVKSGFDLGVAQVGTSGSPVTVNINGIDYQFMSNTFTFDGIEFTVKAPGSTTVVNVTDDHEGIFDVVKDFVDKYNDILKRINEEIHATRHRNYHPLSAEEKEAMSDKEVELWEEKARSGLLRNDPILSSLASQMRVAVYSKIEGLDSEFDSLAAMGITTAKYKEGSPENGTLVIDEEKLRAAIHTHGQEIIDIFTKRDTSGDKNEQMKASGIANRLDSLFKDAVDRLKEKAGSYVDVELKDDSFLGTSIGELNKRIDAFELRMQRLEDKYWQQFTAMEKAIQQMNTQSMWLMQQFAQ